MTWSEPDLPDLEHASDSAGDRAGATVFHTTPDPAAILAAGFVNGDGLRGLGTDGRVGVLLTGRPQLSAGPGNLVLGVTLPEDFDLSEYRLTSRAELTWCVPAERLNPVATLHLLSQDEVDQAIAASAHRWDYE